MTLQADLPANVKVFNDVELFYRVPTPRTTEFTSEVYTPSTFSLWRSPGRRTSHFAFRYAVDANYAMSLLIAKKGQKIRMRASVEAKAECLYIS